MFRKPIRILLPLLLAAIFLSAFSFTAFAEDIPEDIGGGEQVSDIAEDTEYVEPVTEYVGPETEYVEPITEYYEPETEPLEPETEPEEETEPEAVPATQSVQNEYIALIDDAQEPTNFIAPQMDKSVSNKTYSTDYTAGIISWICVAVGIIVVIVMLVSTKVSGRRAMQRRI